MKNLKHPALLTLLSLLIVGCTVSAKWMAYVAVDPDDLNQVLTNATGNVVHVSEQSDGVHITTYDEEGGISNDQVLGSSVDAGKGALNVGSDKLLLVGSTLGATQLLDATAGTSSNLDASLLPVDSGSWAVTGSSQKNSDNVFLFGNRPGDSGNQAWILAIDFAAATSQLIEPASATAVKSAFGGSQLVAAVSVASQTVIVTFDATFSEVGRFNLTNTKESLIGESLGRPTLFNSDNNNVRVTDAAGVTAWEFENAEYEYIKGKSVGPSGHILLWGENSKFNVFSNIDTDSAHYLLISPEGELVYHYLAGKEMAKIVFKHVKQFEDGTIQISYQGWTGELTGFLIGSDSLSTPFRVTRQVYHEFVSLKAAKTKNMNEPKRIETFSQCGLLCLELLTDIEGHCDNLDVYNVGNKGLISVSQVCGAASVDTVKVALY